MRKFLLSFILISFGCVTTQAQEDAVYFELTDSSTMIFPREYIEKLTDDGKLIHLQLKGDTTVSIVKAHIKSQDNTYRGEFPKFESFKFNNKFNDQLFTDAEGEINETSGKITAKVACIGKRLTPSFKVSEGAKAYIDDRRQFSKQSRLRFDEPVQYTVAYPKQFLYQYKKVKDEVWSEPTNTEEEWLETQVELTEDMFSTNAPSNHGEDNPGNMLDGNYSTYFHSTWDNGTFTPLTWYDGAYYGDGTSEWPYLEIALPEPIYQLKFSYTTRYDNNKDYNPLGLILQGSNDGDSWDDIRTLTAESDNLPTAKGATYQSPAIDLGKTYSYLRLQLTAAQRKNYLVFSEFSLYKIEKNPNYGQEEPTLISPAEYIKGFVPYGRNYTVEVDFLTDHPKSEYNVPRIDITFGDGVSWDYNTWIGKNDYKSGGWVRFYEDATIKIDGAGVYPDMEETPMQIRGRGNSSWSSSYNSKNPYRLKFAEKVKPFGMTKGKSWVLLSNKQSGSMTSNAIAMKVADMVQSDGCNHIIPVELYINGHYRGSYNFTEKVGFSNNSIDLDDETNAVMLELDLYYDEAYKFRDANYSLYVNLKEPDLEELVENGEISTEEAGERFAQIKSVFNTFTGAIKKDYDNALLDVESMVRAMLVTDLVRNEELMHPKSWFIYNPDITKDSLWHLGPVWDFDWSFGYERTNNPKTYFISEADNDLFSHMTSSNIGYPFFKKLLRGSDVAKKAYYRLWTEFMNNGKLDELIEYCDDYFKYVEPSFLHNYDGVTATYTWWDSEAQEEVSFDYVLGWYDGNQYDVATTKAKNWLRKRANYIYKHLTAYDLSDDIIELPEELYGQPDRIDVAKVMSRLVNVYNINGVMVRRGVPYGQFNLGLQPGIYIVDGRKVVIKN